MERCPKGEGRSRRSPAENTAGSGAAGEVPGAPRELGPPQGVVGGTRGPGSNSSPNVGTSALSLGDYILAL